jgi:2'-5' RNA ligase
MAKPRRNLRLFAACYPPLSLAQRWLETLDTLPLPPHRLVPPEQVHLTLQFIGDTPVKELDAVLESVERACAGLEPFELLPQRYGPLPDQPSSAPAKLLMLETDCPPTLLELHSRLVIRLATNARANSSRSYRPHLTLCRIHPPASCQCISTVQPTTTDRFVVDRVHLMRSTLSPAGAQHHEVEQFPLVGS